MASAVVVLLLSALRLCWICRISSTRRAISVCPGDAPGVCVVGVLEGAGDVVPPVAIVGAGLVGVEGG